MSKDEKAAGDAKAISDFIEHIKNVECDEILDYVPADPSKWGLDKPVKRLVVETAFKSQYVLEVGAEVEGCYACRTVGDRPSVLRVSKEVISSLFPTLDYLMEVVPEVSREPEERVPPSVGR